LRRPRYGGGATPENLIRLSIIAELGNKISWLDVCPVELPDLIEKRWPNYDVSLLRSLCETRPVTMQPNCQRVMLGDSHMLNWYTPGATVLRNDGKTLHGALKDGIASYLPSHNIDELMVCFGNIDVRHHLCRTSDSTASAIDLANELERQLSLLPINKIIVVQPLPIENESRRLPKTGFYKGTPFYGTYAQRNEVRSILDDQLRVACHKNGWQYLEYPIYFTNVLGELDFNVMEVPGSVHISWEHSAYVRE